MNLSPEDTPKLQEGHGSGEVETERAGAAELKKWAFDFCVSEVDEEILSRSLEKAHAGFPEKENGARIETPLQQSLVLAYATHLDQRKELVRKALKLSEKYALPFSALTRALGGTGLPQSQIEAFQKDLAAALQEGPDSAPSHRFGVSFSRVATQNPNVNGMIFTPDKSVIEQA